MKKDCALQELHCGVTFGFYAKNGYLSSDAAKKEVDEMANTGVRWVVLTPTVMQESYCSPRQFIDFTQTPTEREIIKIIDYIHQKGMKVQLRPMLECFDGCGRTSVWFPWDSERMPGKETRRWAQWFESMRARAVYYARIAQETGCELYGLDSELDRTVLRSNNQHWKDVIAAVRAVYDGPVTSCHTRAVDFLKELKDPDHWFYDLDMLSMSFYYEAAEHPGASVEEMMQFLQPVKEQYQQIAALYQKPIFFGECGCTSCGGAAQNPSWWTLESKYDGGEQARYLEAVLRLFWEEDWWYGIYWWKWDEQNIRPNFTNDPAGDKGFIVKGKPAQQTMREWFGRTDITR